MHHALSFPDAGCLAVIPRLFESAIESAGDYDRPEARTIGEWPEKRQISGKSAPVMLSFNGKRNGPRSPGFQNYSRLPLFSLESRAPRRPSVNQSRAYAHER